MHVRFHGVYVKSPSNIAVRAKTKCSWDLRHINLTNTQQNYKALHTRACTSRRITLGCFTSHSRKSVSLTRAFNTFFCCRTLSVIETCDANLVSTLLSMAVPQSILCESICECWYDERLKTKTVGYTGLLGGLEHVKIETRIIDEKIVNQKSKEKWIKKTRGKEKEKTYIWVSVSIGELKEDHEYDGRCVFIYNRIKKGRRPKGRKNVTLKL